MAKLRPFKALRPVRDKAHLIASLPHYAYKRNVLKAILEVNPYIFLNIIHPEFKSKVKTEANSAERFLQIKEKYADFRESDHLIKDTENSIYLYRQTKGDRVFLGVIGGASVQEYKEDNIKKHEATLTSREAMFTNYLDIVGYNAEPVLLSYTGNKSINSVMNKKIRERPEYEFTTTDLNKHELWILNPDETKKMVKAFELVESTYIADGHHRSASSAGLRQLRTDRKEQHFPNEDYFLAFFIEESAIQILEFNRLVKTMNGHSPDELLELLKIHFHIKPLNRSKKPTKEHDICMCIEGKWYMLTCKDEIIDDTHPVKSLDAEILTNYVLDPILGIRDLKSDENIDFISGNYPVREISKRIRKGDFKIGFILFPVSIDEVKRVADNQMIMPPKSTWVEPKLRSGLTIYNLNE
jgi:uncharacterized protein (DUF1015 family)